MGLALSTTLSPAEAELEDLYEIVNGQKVWPSVAEPESDQLYEVINGQRQEIPRMGTLAATIASFLVTHLNIFGWSHKLGFAVSEALFQLLPDRPQRRPDVAFISYARWQPPPQLQDTAVWMAVPELAVEVLSPTNNAVEVIRKLQDYFDAGVQLVWVFYPEQRWVYVYQSPTNIHILTDADELDGGTVLPGFRLRIADLYTAMQRPQ